MIQMNKKKLYTQLCMNCVIFIFIKELQIYMFSKAAFNSLANKQTKSDKNCDLFSRIFI